MKKLRMIVTSVMVIAIVSGSLAFSAKRVGSFCKSSTDTQDQNCAVVHNAFIQTGISTTFYKSNWNGQSSTCTSTDCHDAVRIVVGND